MTVELASILHVRSRYWDSFNCAEEVNCEHCGESDPDPHEVCPVLLAQSHKAAASEPEK